MGLLFPPDLNVVKYVEFFGDFLKKNQKTVHLRGFSNFPSQKNYKFLDGG